MSLSAYTSGRTIKGSQTIATFLAHPWMKKCSQNATTHAFEWRSNPDSETAVKRSYGGMLKRLRATFYPRYTTPKKRRNESSSKKQGELIHRHLSHMVNCVSDSRCTCDKKTSAKRINKHARQILDKLASLKISLKRAESIMICPEGDFGTRVDLIGVAQEGTPFERSVLISVKTGYKTHFKRKARAISPNMEAPLEQWKDVPVNHHRLQLLMEYLVARHEYDTIFDECLIIYGCHKSEREPHIEHLSAPSQYIGLYPKLLAQIKETD